MPGAGIELQLLDYPGGWLDPVNRPPAAEAQWDECERFLEQASVLDRADRRRGDHGGHRGVPPARGPVDPGHPAGRRRGPAWLKRRNERPDEPALLLFCPVKCESYFADNGGRRDLSATLL